MSLDNMDHSQVHATDSTANKPTNNEINGAPSADCIVGVSDDLDYITGSRGIRAPQ